MRSYVIIIAVMTAARSAVAIELFELEEKIDPKFCTKGQVQFLAKVVSETSENMKYTRQRDQLVTVRGSGSSCFLNLAIEYCHPPAVYKMMNIRSHPSEGTHASKCNGSMVIIGVCVGLEDITYLGMGCHATADSDKKNLANIEEWNRVCSDGDSIGKKADGGHSDKNSISKLEIAVIGAIAAVVAFFSGFFCYKKFFTSKPDPDESVTPVSTDQANKAAVTPELVTIAVPPKEEPKKTVTPEATDEQKTLDKEDTDLKSYKSDLKAPTGETSKNPA